jgi:hypothetical protein
MLDDAISRALNGMAGGALSGVFYMQLVPALVFIPVSCVRALNYVQTSMQGVAAQVRWVGGWVATA